MDAELNLRHWDAWAEAFGTDFRATTKCKTIKMLEVDALARRLSGLGVPAPRVLEVGCGNALNGAALCRMLPGLRWIGCDASPRMIENAHRVIAGQESDVSSRMEVIVANALDLGGFAGERFEAVYTDRCLINLASTDEQINAARGIAGLLSPGGPFLMLENSRQTHARLNAARAALGLPTRPSAPYNVFIDEDVLLPALADVYRLEAVDDFGSLHDLLLYAIKPAADPAHAIVYDDAVMQAAANLSIALAGTDGYTFGRFGQNRLWLFRRVPT